jgi:hypothetical protein
MLDKNLAELYQVPTKRLKEQVKRNLDRFPPDFMFQLSKDEALRLLNASRSHFATLKRGKNIKYLPFVFTEQGVAMLSSVLKSKRAIHVNIIIMRAFVKLRQVLATHKELAHKLYQLEQKVGQNSTEIQLIFKAIKKMMVPPKEKPRKIGFIQ